MAASLHEGLVGEFDHAEVARVHLATSRIEFAATLENPMVTDPRVHHAHYADFMRDPIAVVREYLEFADQPWTADAEAAMRGYLAANRGDRYGKFVYTTDMIGEDVATLHEEFAPYRKRFGIEIERRG